MDRANSLYELDTKLAFVDGIRLPYRLAYVDGMDIVVRDFRSGRRTKLFSDRQRHVVCPLAWSPDGKTLFHAYEQLLAIDVRSRKTHELTSFRNGDRFAIQWKLDCSPDGRTLLFLHHSRDASSKWCIYSVGADGIGLRRVSDLENVWSFKCNWPAGEVVAQTARGTQTVIRIDLATGNARSLSSADLGLKFELMPDGERVLYDRDGTIWMATLDGTRPAEPIARGKVPSLSPDGSTIAFMGGEDDVYLQRLNGGAAKLLLRARVPPADDARRMGSYCKPPLWSPDGKLLCVWSTIGTRFDEPRNPEWVRSLQQRQAAYERTRIGATRKGSGGSNEPVPHFAASIEDAHWQFEHSVGIVDLEGREVWLTRGYWQDAAWAPVTGVEAGISRSERQRRSCP